MKHPEYTTAFFLLFFALRVMPCSAQIDSTNIPLVLIDTHQQTIPDEPKINAKMRIIWQAEQYNHPSDSANVYFGNVGIEIRGRYSAQLPQKPFGFETRDSLSNNRDVALFDMPPEHDWILLANYNDKVFMRNTLTFKLFREMGHYAPRTQFCEVEVNGAYQGIYVLSEKIKRDPFRVDIAKLGPDENTGDDLTGGYIFKIDYYQNDDNWISNFPPAGHADKKVHFVYEYPNPDKITGAQKEYLQNFVNNFENTVYAPNTLPRKRLLNKLLDENSFIDYFIISEVSRNVDAYKKSSFFYKDKDSNGGKLHAGPVWDFDWAWKNIGEGIFGAQDGSGWAFQVDKRDPWPSPPGWMLRFMHDPKFVTKMYARYTSLRENYLSEAYIFHYIDSAASVLQEAQKRHYQKWQILGINVGAPETDAQPVTFNGEIEKFKNWITTRLHWLDAHMPALIVTATNEESQQQTLVLFPNPTDGLVTLESPAPIQEITISDLMGHIVLQKYSADQLVEVMDLKAFLPGVYIINIKLVNGLTRKTHLILRSS